MPIYEFRCAACDHLAELLLGLNDPAPQFCPSCGAEGTMRKAFAPPAIHFKGSGWAKKERRSASSASSAKSGSKSEDADGSSTGGSTAAKKDGEKAASASTDSGSGGSAAD